LHSLRDSKEAIKCTIPGIGLFLLGEIIMDKVFQGGLYTWDIKKIVNVMIRAETYQNQIGQEIEAVLHEMKTVLSSTATIYVTIMQVHLAPASLLS
jgi:hypothetical protein